MPRVSFSPSGSASTQVGNANVSVNPFTLSGGVSGHVASFGEASIDGSIGAGPGGVSVQPKITIGDSKGAATGGKYGGQAGAAVGSVFGPVGTAVGSTVGSAIGSGVGDVFSGNQKVQKETEDRKGLIKGYKQAGFLDDNDGVMNPDGSSFSFKDDDGEGLHNYEINVDSDIDYLAGMAGITASRLHSGRGDSKAVDQLGNGLGNAFLGKAGSGAELTPDSFKAVMTNARAYYAKTGLKSKEDMLGLANKMYSEGRITDFDYATMKQTAGLVFDMDFNTAQKLMNGRKEGVATASQTPSGQHVNRPGRIYSPVLSPEEAFLSVKPLIDYRAAHAPKTSAFSNAASTVVQALGAISAAAGVYKQIDKLTGGQLGEYVSGGLSALGDALGLGDAPAAETFDVSSGGLGELTVSPEPAPVYSSGSDTGFDLENTPFGDFSFS